MKPISPLLRWGNPLPAGQPVEAAAHGKLRWLGVLIAVSSLLAWGAVERPASDNIEPSVLRADHSVPPLVARGCKPGRCPFAGQRVTVLVLNSRLIGWPVLELKDEFEVATGARLDIVRLPYEELFANLMSDMTNRVGKYDAVIAGAWWLGELVAGDYIVPYDKYYDKPDFPRWDIKTVLPGPRSLLEYAGKKYMVANDHDGQVMYYRRDLLADPRHQAAFRRRYGYPLAVPKTWEQFHDVAEYFNGRDLNDDGVPGNGVAMALKAGDQGMFNFMSFSAPFVIGAGNPTLYWFDPQTMKPLLESPGHVSALKTMVELVKFGPREMATWDLGKAWGHFLAGRAALTFTWGDLGALAQQEGSRIKGKVGVAPMPGTHAYYSVAQRRWVKTAQPNLVGNTTGGSWAGVISRYSKAPAASYYLLALMASKEKSLVYASRGWDGIDPGRYYHFLPPNGSGQVDTYLKAGWDGTDVREYSQAYFDSFSNRLQFPYLRIPGTYSYWQALDVHLGEALLGQLTPEEALRAATVDFEEITLRLGREQQRRAYRDSLGL